MRGDTDPPGMQETIDDMAKRKIPELTVRRILTASVKLMKALLRNKVQFRLTDMAAFIRVKKPNSQPNLQQPNGRNNHH